MISDQSLLLSTIVPLMIINNIKHAVNNTMNFAPKSGTLASTDHHTIVVLLLGRSVIVD